MLSKNTQIGPNLLRQNKSCKTPSSQLGNLGNGHAHNLLLHVSFALIANLLIKVLQNFLIPIATKVAG